MQESGTAGVVSRGDAIVGVVVVIVEGVDVIAAIMVGTVVIGGAVTGAVVSWVSAMMIFGHKF